MKHIPCSLLYAISFLISHSLTAQDSHLKVIRSRITNEAGQQFLCAAPYTAAECEKQVVILQTTLHHYQAEKLGHWTWVLVHSEDWKPILERVHRDPNSPAFSILERRQTFFEEALLVPKPERQIELISKWKTGSIQLLDLAVTHELGHALCDDFDETRAEELGKRLRMGRTPNCDLQRKTSVRSR